MKNATKALVCALLFVGTDAATAAEPADNRKILARYEARLSKHDHVSSKGKRLTTAAAVLQRDREHVFLSNQGSGAGGGQDLEDNLDPYFVSRERLGAYEQALARGHIDAATAKAILKGTPLVSVTVYQDATGQVSVDVKFLRGGEAVVEESF